MIKHDSNRDEKPIIAGHLNAFSTDTTSQVNITDHDGDTLAVDGAQVDILKETDQVGFSSFLQGSNGSGLETQVSLVVLGNFTDKTLEGQLADQQFSALLVTTDFTEGDSAGTETMRLLDTTGGDGGRFAGCLGSDLFARSLSTSGFTSSLFSTCHLFVC